jgi:hypothetical protein
MQIAGRTSDNWLLQKMMTKFHQVPLEISNGMPISHINTLAARQL